MWIIVLGIAEMKKKKKKSFILEMLFSMQLRFHNEI